MAEQFLHGIETIEIDDGIRPIRTVKSSVIGLIGTAPDADATIFPLNEPVAIVGNPRIAAELGADGTLKDAIDRIFDQAGATVVVVRVEEGETLGETRGNVAGDAVSQTGVWTFLQARTKLGLTPRILVAPGFTDYRVTDGVLDVTMTEQGSGYTEAPAITFDDNSVTPLIAPKFTAILGTGVNAGKVVEVRIDNPGEGVDTGSSITIAAPPSGTTATATLSFGTARNPIVSEMMGISDRLRAVIIADAPATTDAAAIQWREDYGHKRIYVIDPKVLVYDGPTNSHVAYPASACVAGLISRMDKERGFWWSPSNQEIYGITGVSRPIDFNISDPDTQANYLNENEVATIIRYEGYRLWGNRTTSSDPNWAFLSVRRTADMVYESLEEAFLWAVDRPFSQNNIVEIAESVNAYLRHLTAVGAILGGKAWIDPTINTKDQMLQGILSVDFDIEPPAPIEHLKFRAHRNPDYYEELIDDVIRELAI